MYRVGVGKVQDYGLPEPDHKLGDAHPTISADFLNRIAHGEMTWKPNLARLDGDRVVFEDGSSEEIDIIVYCTGYKVTFPFFDEDFISAPDNDLPLFRRVFKPGIDNLAFIGLLQPLGAIMPLAEAQGRWLGVVPARRVPPAAAARRWRPTSARARADVQRYVASKRHTMQVDFDNYLYELGKELKAGAARARAAGFALPVAARARAGARRRRDRRGGRSRASASRPRRTTAQRSSPPRARCSPSSGTTPPGCATSIRRTELASGTFYNYFPDKEAVFRAVLDESAQEVRRRLRDARSGAQTLERSSATPTAAWFEFLVEDQLMFELMQRNAGPIRALFGDPILGSGVQELLDDITRRDRPRRPAPARRRLHGRRDGRRRARARRADGRALTGRRRGRGAVRHRAVPRRDRAPERGRSPGEP